MTTLEYRAVCRNASSASTERAYFVRTSDVMSGAFPYAEPVVLVQPDFAARHPMCRALEIVEAPASPALAPPLRAALPLFILDMHAAYEYEAARPAIIVRDLRRR
jgi:hypothetical protein